AGARRRRSRLPVLHPRPPERAGVRGRDDARHQSLDLAGISRSRPLWVCAVAFFRLLGRLQGDRRDGREFGLDPCRSGSRQDRAARRFRDAAGRAQHPLARSAPLEAEKRLFGPKMEAVKAFARANALDRIVLDGKPARLGIITTGKAYLDLRQAMADLGISERDAE